MLREALILGIAIIIGCSVIALALRQSPQYVYLPQQAQYAAPQTDEELQREYQERRQGSVNGGMGKSLNDTGIIGTPSPPTGTQSGQGVPPPSK